MSPAALGEFTKVSQVDWQGGVPLVELLARINRVAVALVGVGDPAKSEASRVKRIFTERSFRHYQTLGCIAAPEKRGRLANYGFIHFLQALLVRKLLWERLSAEQITKMLVGRGADELERMLLGGEADKSESTEGLVETWNRVCVAPGLELHLSSSLPRYNLAETRRLIGLLKKVLRRQGS